MTTFNRQPKRVVLVGAGGFLGTNLARHLADRVEILRCFGHPSRYPSATEKLTWIRGELGDVRSMSAALQGCDTVVHMASNSTPSNADRSIPADAEANVVATLRLLDCCVSTGVERVVFISSGGTVYGVPDTIPIPESAPVRPITAYGVAKLAIEKYLEVYRHLLGLDYRILRVSNPYGPFQTTVKGQGAIAAFLSTALSGHPVEIWGNGSVVRDYLYVEDAIEAIMLAMVHGGSQRVFNIGSGIGLNLLEVVTAIERLLGRPVEVRYLPGRRVDVPVNVLDCSVAEVALNWRAKIGLNQGLELTANWMRNEWSL